MKKVILITLAAPAFLWSVCLFVVLLVVFLPFALVRLLLRPIPQQLATTNRRDDKGRPLYDRTHDVSKLVGCNTRGVHYRWSIFTESLGTIEAGEQTLRALDFGAGSLRDTYELARRGYDVYATDLNLTRTQFYFKEYDWSQCARSPVIVQPADLMTFSQYFDLILAYDVIEHVPDVRTILDSLRTYLRPSGMLFITVPNCRSVAEQFFKLGSSAARKGQITTNGDSHLQFHTPAGWKRIFAENGFRVRSHDLEIGAIANNLFHGLVKIPLLFISFRVFGKVLSLLGYHLPKDKIVAAFEPNWLMEGVNIVDQALKPLLRPFFGWNLFVLTKAQEETIETR